MATSDAALADLPAADVARAGLRALADAGSATELWLALNWAVWGVLWFMYFLLLAQGRPIQRQTGWVTLLAGIFTGWLPGFLLLDGLI